MPAKPLVDADQLISMFENATADGSGKLKKAVGDATLAALQGRELTLSNIKSSLKKVAEAASAGAAKNTVAGVDPAALLDKAVQGMDAAVLKAVEANRTALATLTAQGADLREKHLKKAMADLDRIEDTMFAAMKKASETAGAPLAGAWSQVLEKMQAGGTLSGAQASAAAEQVARMAEQMQGALKTTRATSMRAAQALAESYTAMVSGVLLGMSEALQSAGSAAAAGKAAKK
ncbi:MAG: hypothetical protein JNL30_03790 [Rubrivivax sp.]|nr:hypothetical protein [Rubrivivax sp.]